MISESFKEIIRSKTGCVVIMAGSYSDDESKNPEEPSHIEQIAMSLESFGIPYQVRIKSAHKQPAETEKLIKEYDAFEGAITFIVVAGGTDALSGTASYHALSGPVISCPPDAPNESCLTNPPGSCNAYVANPKNVGKLVAQIYSVVNSRFRGRLIVANQEKIDKLREKDIEINLEYEKRQGR